MTRSLSVPARNGNPFAPDGKLQMGLSLSKTTTNASVLESGAEGENEYIQKISYLPLLPRIN